VGWPARAPDQVLAEKEKAGMGAGVETVDAGDVLVSETACSA